MAARAEPVLSPLFCLLKPLLEGSQLEVPIGLCILSPVGRAARGTLQVTECVFLKLSGLARGLGSQADQEPACYLLSPLGHEREQGFIRPRKYQC